MAWNPFYIKQTPSIASGSSISLTDQNFPFSNTTIYKNISVWVTTTGSQAQYTISISLNDVIQDSIISGPSKSVNNYLLEQLLVKDTSLPFKVTVNNNSTTTTTFIVIVVGEYWS